MNTIRIAVILAAAGALMPPSPGMSRDIGEGRRADPDAPMAFELAASSLGNMRGMEWTAAQGVITPETPDVFRAYAEERRYGIPPIRLNSPGGNLLAAMELGRLFREKGLTVEIGGSVFDIPPGPDDPSFAALDARVEGMCASACAYAYMGGATRQFDEHSRLGLHQFYRGDDAAPSVAESLPSGTGFSAEQLTQGLVVAYLVEMDIDPTAVLLASSAGPDEMYWLTAEEARNLGIDNASRVHDAWLLEPWGDGLVATTGVERGARWRVDFTLFCDAAGAHALLSTGNLSLDPGEAGRLARSWGPVRVSVDGTEIAEIGNSHHRRISDEIDVRVDDGKTWVTVDLAWRVAERIAAAEVFDVTVQTARIYAVNRFGGWGYRRTLDRRGRQILGLALRNCV